MTYETLLFEVSDGLAKITLNRPGAANSLNGAMAHDLMLAATICGIEMGLRLAGIAHNPGGVGAALAALVRD